MFRSDAFRLDSTRATTAVRALLICFLAACSWWTTGSARAQSCTAMGNQIVQAPGHLVVNRQTPMGRLYDHASESTPLPANLVLSCNGPIGSEIEVEARFVGSNVRSDPFGGLGVLLDSNVAGIGLQVEASMALNSVGSAITTPAGGDLLISRTRPALDRVEVLVRAYPAKTGDIDLSTSHKIHQQPVLEVRWRPRGQATWSGSHVFRLQELPQSSPHNVRAETCYFGSTPNTPYTRNHRMRSVSSGDFSGVGSEWLAYLGGDNYIILNCRNFVGGRLRVDSPTRHPTLAGAVDNAHAGEDAATGLALRMRHSGNDEPWDLRNPWPIESGLETRTIGYFPYYIQTGTQVTPGRFSATITLTIEYN